MKSKTLLATLLLTLTLPASAAHQLKTWTHTSPSKKVTFKYVYPQVTGVSAAVNDKLRTAYLPTPAHIKDLEGFAAELGARYAEDITGEVMLQTPRLLSVYYSGLGVLTPSAHPTKIFGAVTLDLKTGKALKLKDILKPGSLPKVKQEAIKALDPILETRDIPEVSQASDFEFYLTKDHLVLINIFEAHVVASVHAEIPRSSLKGLLLF